MPLKVPYVSLYFRLYPAFVDFGNSKTDISMKYCDQFTGYSGIIVLKSITITVKLQRNSTENA